MKTKINKFLNAHYDCNAADFRLCDIYDTLIHHPELNPPHQGPFLYATDSGTPTPEQLARITWLFIDTPALEFGFDYLQQLPNLREIQLYTPGISFSEVDFLKKLPELRVLRIECEEICSQLPLSDLKQLTHLNLDYPEPFSEGWELPNLEYLYLQQANFWQVEEFLHKHPDCQVEFEDDQYEVLWESRVSRGRAFRFFTLITDDLLEIFMYPLIPSEFSEDLSAPEQGEILAAMAPICDDLLAEYRNSSNCILWEEHENLWDGYVFKYRFQSLSLPCFREELLAAPRELRELLKEGFDADKIDWWLLKYGDLHAELLRRGPGLPLPSLEDSFFTYAHSAEASFLEAYRKLDNMLQLWRPHPEKERELLLRLSGYHLELALPWPG